MGEITALITLMYIAVICIIAVTYVNAAPRPTLEDALMEAERLYDARVESAAEQTFTVVAPAAIRNATPFPGAFRGKGRRVGGGVAGRYGDTGPWGFPTNIVSSEMSSEIRWANLWPFERRPAAAAARAVAKRTVAIRMWPGTPPRPHGTKGAERTPDQIYARALTAPGWCVLVAEHNSPWWQCMLDAAPCVVHVVALDAAAQFGAPSDDGMADKQRRGFVCVWVPECLALGRVEAALRALRERGFVVVGLWMPPDTHHTACSAYQHTLPKHLLKTLPLVTEAPRNAWACTCARAKNGAACHTCLVRHAWSVMLTSTPAPAQK
jgi:hypothetical protein